MSPIEVSSFTLVILLLSVDSSLLGSLAMPPALIAGHDIMVNATIMIDKNKCFVIVLSVVLDIGAQ